MIRGGQIRRKEIPSEASGGARDQPDREERVSLAETGLDWERLGPVQLGVCSTDGDGGRMEGAALVNG